MEFYQNYISSLSDSRSAEPNGRLPLSEQVPDLFPQEPEPEPEETKRLRGKCSRAGLSVAVLYGAMSKAQSIAIILCSMVLSAWLLFRPLPDLDLSELGHSVSALMSDLRDSNLITVVLIVILACQAIGSATGVVLMRLLLPPQRIEKRTLPFGRFLFIALVCFGVWGVGAALGNLSAYFGVETDSLFSVETLGKAMLPYLLYAVIGAPILEELAFRKALLDGLHGTHEGYAAILSGLLFGLMHGNHHQFFLAFFIGLVFAMVYQRTGRVIYTMLLHGMINLTATLPEFFSLAGADITLVWNIAVGVLVAAGLVVFIVRRKDPLFRAAPTTIPDANNAVYRNPGMRLVRIAALILIGAQGTLLLFLTMLATEVDRWGVCLIDLIPLVLTFLTVFLLPVFTKRYEQHAVDVPLADCMEEAGV